MRLASRSTSAPAARSASPTRSAPSSSTTVTPSSDPVSSSSRALAMTVPPPMITAASHTRSTSSRRCDDSRMSMPNSVPMRRMSASMSSRCTGSSPSVGSSSTISPGSCTSACASFTRCRCPVDMVPTGRNRSSPSPTSHSASLARAVASRWGRPCTSAMWRTRSWARISSGRSWCSGEYPRRARILGPERRGSRPNTRISPASGGCSPRIIPIVVVLPAPFDPSSPVTPRPTVKVTSLSTGVAPHAFATPVASITAPPVADIRRRSYGRRRRPDGHRSGAPGCGRPWRRAPERCGVCSFWCTGVRSAVAACTRTGSRRGRAGGVAGGVAGAGAAGSEGESG